MSAGHGQVWIVGAGPGDPGLITVAGLEALRSADAVVYDALAPAALLRHARTGAELIAAGKRAGSHEMGQEAINALLVARAGEGQRVVRLKGGDPFVFGRGGEEALACRRAGVAYTIVPGVTSAIAAPAYAGIPLTHRGLSADALIVTASGAGEEGPEVDWEAAARAGTLVVLMGAARLAEVVERLLGAGRAVATPAACIQWGTRFDQRVVAGTLADIAGRAAEAGLGAPMVTVVGSVVALGDDLAWFNPGSLAGKRVVVTRSRQQASELAVRFEGLGATVIEAPVIRIVEQDVSAELARCLEQAWDWLAFTSGNGVDAFFANLKRLGKDARALGGARIAAVGPATGWALEGRALVADFRPSVATARALGGELPEAGGKRVLFAGSAIASGGLVERLRARGAAVEYLPVYDTVSEPLAAGLRAEVLGADAITFASSSTARGLREALAGSAVGARVKLVSIGPQTSMAVREAFERVDAEAERPGFDGLVEATVRALQ